ncbi:MAG: hypothetical protein CVT62_00400 [Actinobacteria bacterium HGW-Actinobacteria-2]|nr:MAG: hypothetical protein CVT62_00400 [Actinobacteria bacterium HGW-Actinobacteria-2]
MSAVLVDDLLVEEFLAATPVRLRLLPGGADLDAVEPTVVMPAVSPVAVPRRTSGTLRLTNRGIAVILGTFVTLFATGVAVAVTSFLAVSDAPLSAPAVVSVAR